MNLILLRHGESQWNLENRFTGWKDVPLTSNGQSEARFAAHQLIKNNLQINTIHTSLLRRAIQTAKIVSEMIDFPENQIVYDWRLNERHYGALQGLNKSETASKYGEDQVLIWRRSFDIAPPLLDFDDERHPRFNSIFNHIKEELPAGESLKNVINRLNPFLENYMQSHCKEGKNHLIVAHSNSLRAIIKSIEGLSSEEIISVNIPTGLPLVYKVSTDWKILDKKYLVDDKELKKKQKIVENQGKAQ